MRPTAGQEGEALCVIDIEPVEGAVKLTIDHSMPRPDSKLIEAVSGGWPSILSNLKSLLETGQVILTQLAHQADRRDAERRSPGVGTCRSQQTENVST